MLFLLRMFVLAILALLLVFIIMLLRKQKLELKYCLVWLIAIIGIAILCIFPNLLDELSGLLGIGMPVNAFFLICIAFLACICISLTIVVSNLSSRLRELVQNLAIREKERENDNKE